MSHVRRKPKLWFPNRSDTNRAIQAQKTARGWKIWMTCTIRVAKTKALISFAVTAKLICAFGFAYAVCWFSHEAAHMINILFKTQITNYVIKPTFDLVPRMFHGTVEDNYSNQPY